MCVAASLSVFRKADDVALSNVPEHEQLTYKICTSVNCGPAAYLKLFSRTGVLTAEAGTRATPPSVIFSWLPVHEKSNPGQNQGQGQVTKGHYIQATFRSCYTCFMAYFGIELDGLISLVIQGHF